MARGVRRLMPGQMVVFKRVPLSLLKDGDRDEKEAIVDASIGPMRLLGYRPDDGKAEFEVEDRKGVRHAFRVDPIHIEPVEEAAARRLRTLERRLRHRK